MFISAKKLNLKRKFIVMFVLFAVIPMGALTGITLMMNNGILTSTNSSITSKNEKYMSGIALEIAQNLNNYMEARKSDLSNLMKDPTVRTSLDAIVTNSALGYNDSHALATSFSNNVNSYTTNQPYDAIFLMNTSGIVLAYGGITSNLTGHDLSTRTYFQGALNNAGTSTSTDQVFYDKIFYGTISKQFVFDMAGVVRSESTNKVEGVIAMTLNLPTIFNLLAPTDSQGNANNAFYQQMGLGNTGETFIVDPALKIDSPSRFNTIYPDQSFINNVSYNTPLVQQALQTGMANGFGKDYRNNSVYSVLFYLGSTSNVQSDARPTWMKTLFTADLPWVLVVKINSSELNSLSNNISNQQTNMTFLMLALGVIITAIIVLIGSLLANSYTKPLIDLSNESKRIANGDLSIETANLKGGSNDEVGILKQNYFEMVKKLTNVIKEITSVANVLKASAEGMASSSEEMNATSEELSAVTQQISNGAQSQMTKIINSQTLALKLKETFDTKMQDISNTGKVIEGISRQINILALNASIEAARAGDYGRGFAVVADHIRTLSNDTNSSLQSIDDSISGVQGVLSNSINEILKAIEEISTVAEETASSSEEASASTEEQTATMQEFTSSAQELAQIAFKLDSIVTEFNLNGK